MRIGLFIPCYVDQFYPQIGLGTLRILEQIPGAEVIYPEEQTCCGQPMANTGCLDDTRPVAEMFVELFSDFDHVVSPSGSCISMVRNHYQGFFHNSKAYDKLRTSSWELCEFLVDVLPKDTLTGMDFAPFPKRVGLHSSCHGLRELRLGNCSERMHDSGPSKVVQVLNHVPELQLVDLARTDECCGFGGTFAVAEEGVSVMMGIDRVQDHISAGAEIMTATDASCLMHMQGLVSRESLPLRCVHVAEILGGTVDA